MDYLCHPSRKEREFMSPLLSEQKMITEQRAVSGMNLQKKKTTSISTICHFFPASHLKIVKEKL